MDEYWQQVARELIATRKVDYFDPEAIATWIGRASVDLAEALRVSGDSRATQNEREAQ
jgi:hypothetical protein